MPTIAADPLITAYEARDLYGIPTRRIHQWRHEGRAVPQGYAGLSPLFHLGDLVRLNDAANAHPRAKRIA